VISMPSGCRDCRVCTTPGLSKLGRSLARGTVHLSTAGMSYAAERAVWSHCPAVLAPARQHERRRDGSFKD